MAHQINRLCCRANLPNTVLNVGPSDILCYMTIVQMIYFIVIGPYAVVWMIINVGYLKPYLNTLGTVLFFYVLG